MVNAIPETVTLESYVRGSSFDAITKANKKVNRALTGAAYSIGTNIEIVDIPGYAPLHDDPKLVALSAEAAKLAIPEYEYHISDKVSSGSTDMGDLCCVMPVVQPYAGGVQGRSHGNNYEVVDPVAACVGSAKLQMGMLLLLLENDAQRAKKVIAEYKPLFDSNEAYLQYMDSLNKEGDRIVYNEDETVAKINLD